MPQLLKGGKYVFGWSKVNSEGRIVVPDEALKEYRLTNVERVILLSGSKTSGGFGVTSVEKLKNSALAAILENCPQLENMQLAEGEATVVKGRVYCWVKMNPYGSIAVPLATLKKYGVHSGSDVLVVRGSNVALGFIARGPIFEEAKKHPEIPVYG